MQYYTWQLALVLVPVYFIKPSVSCYIYYIILEWYLNSNNYRLPYALKVVGPDVLYSTH